MCSRLEMSDERMGSKTHEELDARRAGVVALDRHGGTGMRGARRYAYARIRLRAYGRSHAEPRRCAYGRDRGRAHGQIAEA